MKAPVNKLSVAIGLAVASLLAAGWANAEVTDGKGKTVKWTADRYIEANGLRCVYGKPRIETDSNGRTIIATPKVCR